MITLPGQLAIKTIRGRNGDFNVGRLETSIGEFVTKNAELDQYREGKYEGDFIITEIRPSMYTTGGRMVIELRAHLGGMTLHNIDRLSKDEAHGISPQEMDPADEDDQSPRVAAAVAAPASMETRATADPLVDTTPFGIDTPTQAAEQAQAEQQQDAELFGALWPLTPVVKLDATVNRRVLRQQRDRLDQMGYDFDPLTQRWSRQAA